MRTIFGLPAHPLVVHLAVVLVPVATIVSIIAAVRSTSLRTRWSTSVAAVAVLAALSVLTARQTGTSMYRWMNEEPPIARHRALASTSVVLTLAFAIAAVLAAVVARRRASPAVTRAAAAAAAVVGLLATVWIVRTGHEGARVTWLVTVRGESG